MLKLSRTAFVEILGLIFLLVVTVALRFPNLGYSDFIGDEHKSVIRIEPEGNLFSFFMDQRKGPMQFLISYIPKMFVGDFRNELAQRVPFTLFGIASIFVFYFLIRKLTNDKLTALLSSLLLSVNGFIVAFARIAQYQDLNLFFSFLALYFYSDFLNPNFPKEKLLRNTLFGTVSFAISLLAHWDAVFVLLPIVYFLIVYTKNKQIPYETKKNIVIKNLLLGCVILLPFLVPYLIHQVYDAGNKGYFLRRVSPGLFAIENYGVLFRLYNPYLVMEFILATALIGLLGKNSILFFSWFLLNYSIFQIFVRKPGTHIYNFIIPLIILSALGISWLVQKFPKYLKLIPVTIFLFFYSYFFYQSYMVFVDNRIEYPWEKEQLSGSICIGKSNSQILFGKITCKDFLSYFKTPTYTIEDKLPLFGFPFSRNWNEINAYINEQNRVRNENYGYTSNELKTITEKYMDAKYRVDNGFYIVAIREPFSLIEDWSFGNYRNKKLVKEFHKGDQVIVKIYRVESGRE